MLCRGNPQLKIIISDIHNDDEPSAFSNNYTASYTLNCDFCVILSNLFIFIISKDNVAYSLPRLQTDMKLN